MSMDDTNLRPPASLTAALLARKGAARPAGFAAVTPGATPGVTGAAPRHLPDGDGAARARLTLRLDETRHLRLKLTSAHLQRSLQEILTEALDRYLDQVSPEMLSSNCVCLKARSHGAGK